MRIATTGSIATDHLMAFPGRFAEQLVADRLSTISLSFLVDGLEVRRGGVAANIALGLSRLGLAPLLVGAAGQDFADYRLRLEDSGVDTSGVRISADLQTARFVCTTDADSNQIASFYTGAMSEAREIGLAPIAERSGGLDLVVVSPNDPVAMLRHTAECRSLGIPFAADPGQQIARLDGGELRQLVDDAWVLFTNEYEAALLARHTGWTEDEILARVGTWITTLGADGVKVSRCGQQPVRIPAVAVPDPVEPTGLGDAFRAGFLAAVSWGLPAESAARLGCAVASTALRVVGPQDYRIEPDILTAELRRTYGTDAATELAAFLGRLK
ncbi:carbohydrate kinase family protein [Saccharothrix sp. ST-888]|uniref:carbohydrate kinase family protein n=1 Tax=Saccharothrix sp. ST-888 TaxID=1427391 RepID=UPI0005EC3353|nr:carbohydrate kinase family protein [Saccharothrix sp. ST-888]KJK54841.1 ribokinase [Saccharothrix sp. ST-888]